MELKSSLFLRIHHKTGILAEIWLEYFWKPQKWTSELLTTRMSKKVSWERLWQNQSATDFHKVDALVASVWVLLVETLVFDCILVESLAKERSGAFFAVNVSEPDVVFLSSHILHPRWKSRQQLCIRHMGWRAVWCPNHFWAPGAQNNKIFFSENNFFQYYYYV